MRNFKGSGADIYMLKRFILTDIGSDLCQDDGPAMVRR